MPGCAAGRRPPLAVRACVEINQCVGCRAVRNRHRHAIEQASRRTQEIAGRLRCCRAPPPGPRAGAGRCVGLGLSPAIIPGQSFVSLLLSTCWSTGQRCVRRNKAVSRKETACNRSASDPPYDSRPGSRRLQGALPRAADAVNCKERTLAEALSLGCTQSGEATPGARASSTRSASTREQA